MPSPLPDCRACVLLVPCQALCQTVGPCILYKCHTKPSSVCRALHTLYWSQANSSSDILYINALYHITWILLSRPFLWCSIAIYLWAHVFTVENHENCWLIWSIWRVEGNLSASKCHSSVRNELICMQWQCTIWEVEGKLEYENTKWFWVFVIGR